MKSIRVLLCVLCLATVAPAAERSISLVTVGAVDPAMAERVRAFAQENLALPVRLLAPREAAPAATLNDIGAAAGAAMGEGDVCLVVLAWPLEDFPNHGILMPEANTAVVNARALKPEGDDAERYGRRLEREVMMSIGLLLGLEACPNPECALWLYSNDEELDAKGRNYCPPCLARVQALGQEKGLALVTDSPFAPPAVEPMLDETPAEPEPVPVEPAPAEAAPAEMP